MSLIFMDGFEDNMALQKWDGGGNYGYAAGRNGQGLYLVDSNVGQIKKQVVAADEHATFIFGKAYRNRSGANTSEAWIQSGGQYGAVVTFLSDNLTTAHISVCLEGGNTINVRRGLVNGTLLGSYVVASVDWTAWYYFEVKCTLSDTVGVVEVKLNGQTVINLTGQDTKNGGTKTVFDGFAMGGNHVANGVHNMSDDLWLCNGAGSANNDFLGDCAIETLYPNGDGSLSMLVGSDGNSVNNSLLVDEPNTVILTDYVQGASVADKDLYALANLARTSGTVYGVQALAHAVNTDSGARSAGVILKSGGTTTTVVGQALSTTPAAIRRIWEQDPNTSAPWTVSGVNALEAGFEVAS